MKGISLFLEQDKLDLRELQFTKRAGFLDLTWGHPDPLLLPVQDIRIAYDAVLSQSGWLPLSYGYSQGSGALRTAIADDLSVHGVSAESIVVTAGSTGALDLYLTLHAEPGDIVYVEQPTYFLALKLFQNHDMQIVGIPRSDGYLTSAHLVAAVETQASESTKCRAFLYLVPTNSNPTGQTIPESERSEIVEFATRHGITILEDDVYSDLGDGSPSPLWTYNPSSVVKFGSFSKTIAPGLRLGYAITTPSKAQVIAQSGLLNSGGGMNPLTAHAVAYLYESGRYRDIVGRLKNVYKRRMEALLVAIEGTLIPICKPCGGFFIWCQVPNEMTVSDFVSKTAEIGVVVEDGKYFFTSGYSGVNTHVRLSCSLLDEGAMQMVGERLDSLDSI